MAFSGICFFFNCKTFNAWFWKQLDTWIFSADRNLRAIYTDLYNMTNHFRHVNSLCQLSQAVKMRSFAWMLFGKIKSSAKQKAFHFVNVFCCFQPSAWLNGARLHLDLLRQFGFLMADVWPDGHERPTAIDRVEEVPRLLRDLPWISPCRVSDNTTYVNIAHIVIIQENTIIQSLCKSCSFILSGF